MGESKGSGRKKTPAQPPERDADDESVPEETLPDDTDERSDGIAPLREKIGEGEDNLRRREEWFRKRTGGKE